jgi:hypothetical protein
VPQHSLILESANGHLFDASINRADVREWRKGAVEVWMLEFTRWLDLVQTLMDWTD